MAQSPAPVVRNSVCPVPEKPGLGLHLMGTGAARMSQRVRYVGMIEQISLVMPRIFALRMSVALSELRLGHRAGLRCRDRCSSFSST